MEKLKNNIINLFGEKGKNWLNALPKISDAIANHWSLKNITAFDNLTFNFVAQAINSQGNPVVIKVGLERSMIEDEIKALKHFNGQGTVELIDTYLKYNAMLLQRALPGHALKALYPKEKIKVFNAYQKIVNQLAEIPLTDDLTIKPISHWLKAFTRVPHAPIPDKLFEKGLILSKQLIKTQQETYLLHGDLHHDNIVSHQEKWLAIDPKGIIGEKAFEAAAFDFVHESEYQTDKEFSALLKIRTQELSKRLNLDSNRLLQWIYVRLILSALWWIEDGGNPNAAIKMAASMDDLV